MSNFDAKAELSIEAPVREVWKALTNADSIKKYMFGATVVSDWKEGSSIVWKGEWNGKPFEDHGKVLVVDPLHELKYSHVSPRPGAAKEPDAHVVDILLTPLETGTFLALTQENNSSEEEKMHSEKNWNAMLMAMKQLLEAGSIPAPKQGAKAAN